MEWTRFLCCLALFFLSASASTIETLDKIDDLKTKAFGQEYPRHGLLLLHWLANHISISQSEDILLHFVPARQDYGFRYYESSNETSSPLPYLDDSSDRAYYSLGSLSSKAVRTKLPPYVTQDYYNAFEDPKRDLDRIVLRVYRTNPSRADKVYITQAVSNEQDADYDPDETFEINPNLLTQIQILKSPLDIIQILESHAIGAQNSDDPRLVLSKDQLLYHLKNSDKRLQTIFEDPGIRWLLILAGYDIDNRYNIHKKTWSCSADEPIRHDQISRDPETLCEGHSTVKIEVKSTEDGYAKILWSGLPKNIIEKNSTIVLFSSDTSSELMRFTEIRGQTSGSYETYLALNHGIHPRLVVFNFVFDHGFFGLHYSVIWRGSQFDEANRVIPTEITGYKASLQLYTVGGYACARIYIRKSFTDWRRKFANSWVSFYSSAKDLDQNYEHYQWVTSFNKADNTEEYLIYEYMSSMSIGPGVQARFIFSSGLKMERQNLFCGFLFNMILTSAAAIQTLQDIKDLENTTTSMKEFPRHGLMLLHWFANTVDVDSGGDMELHFDPGQGSYGLHCYEDTDKRAPFDASESLYYSLGDLDRRSARMLPFYVLQDFHHSGESPQKNVDRVLLQVQKSNPRKVEKVYMTEYHKDQSQGRSYNPDETYEISVKLLIQIRALGTDIACETYDPRLDFSLCEYLNHQQKAAKVLMVYPQVPGLEWFLTLAGYNIDPRLNIFLQASFCAFNQTTNPNDNCSPPSNGISDVMHNNVKLEVKSTSGGYAKITWSGIPENVARMKLKIGIYKGRTNTDPLKEYPLKDRTYGSIDTTVPLNPGLHVQLLQSEKIPYYFFFRTTYYTMIWKGPELDEANGIPPVNIRGYQSSLQLYTKNGYACARLYIKKSFMNWKNVFNNAWVAIYASKTDDNAKYKEYEWSINFEKSPKDDCPLDYEIYQYESSVHIGLGVQARFMLTSHYGSEKARTAPWEE
ncbi:hypothetical protein QTP70_011555 [Hemibagrus guttatus]|uniref:Uncharacterized protein n=1 Tax=Hemibagrus guttatus TaxID=175788 RepID=A0AAE0UIX8_9TELE|nr:hypothetical protein QTP70_011555 [Hemibagrus guttatus]